MLNFWYSWCIYLMFYLPYWNLLGFFFFFPTVYQWCLSLLNDIPKPNHSHKIRHYDQRKSRINLFIVLMQWDQFRFQRYFAFNIIRLINIPSWKKTECSCLQDTCNINWVSWDELTLLIFGNNEFHIAIITPSIKIQSG